MDEKLTQALHSLRDNSISFLNLTVCNIIYFFYQISFYLAYLLQVFLFFYNINQKKKRNKIGTEGVNEISKSLLSNTSLKNLYLGVLVFLLYDEYFIDNDFSILLSK